MEKINKLFGNIAGLIRLIFFVLILIWCFKALNTLVQRLDSSIPQYTTQHIRKPQYRPEPDTKVKGIEHLTQQEVNPIIVHDSIYYDEPGYEHMIRSIKAHGKYITVQTQYCGVNAGMEYVYPHVSDFQIAALDDDLHFTMYKNYFDWTGLSGELYLSRTENVGVLKTGIEYIPLRLKADIFISTQKSVGIKLEKRFW